ncbi:MAG: CBS domain-containing protein [Lachnospiraceae bacterium]|jgi:CBS domain-containing protein
MNIIQLLSPKGTVAYLIDELSIPDALESMRECGFTAIPVITKEGRYAGVIREGDFLWAWLDGSMKDEKGRYRKVRDLLKPERDRAADINTDPGDVFRMALDQNFVPIVDDRNMFIGIVTRKKVINHLLSKLMEM